MLVRLGRETHRGRALLGAGDVELMRPPVPALHRLLLSFSLGFPACLLVLLPHAQLSSASAQLCPVSVLLLVYGDMGVKAWRG